ncbi:MAG: exopolysaccharide biosynthesis protein [Verrucomicrobia bacterium]|nr:exopolysaccharide biosynthesis protein [Verrucomicrobiota bacterium]
MTNSATGATARVGAISAVADRLAKTLDQSGLTVAQLVFALEGKGHAAIMAVLSLPFCFPIQVPGLSTPFGFILIFSGLRIAFGQAPWLPGWLMVREIPKPTALGLLKGLRWIAVPAEKILHPRLPGLCRNVALHRTNGMLVAFLAILLALPLPIPFSNLLAAVPILLISLALLEDDGAFLIAGYLAAIPCVSLWIWISHFWA